jgi:hypothetical protein
MKWETGEKIRIVYPLEIAGGYYLRNSKYYDITDVHSTYITVLDDEFEAMNIHSDEWVCIEKFVDDFEYEMSDAELGEPSESPNVTLSEIYEGICDMKAMIGRLIRNGGDEE